MLNIEDNQVIERGRVEEGSRIKERVFSMENLRGQNLSYVPASHGAVCIASSRLHGAPPYLATGLLQCLCLTFIPPSPHVFEQGLHSSQAPHPPFSMIKKVKKIRNLLELKLY